MPVTSGVGATSPWSCPGRRTRPSSSLAARTVPTRQAGPCNPAWVSGQSPVAAKPALCSVVGRPATVAPAPLCLPQVSAPQYRILTVPVGGEYRFASAAAKVGLFSCPHLCLPAQSALAAALCMPVCLQVAAGPAEPCATIIVLPCPAAPGLAGRPAAWRPQCHWRRQ